MSRLKILLADDSRFFRTIEAKFLQKTPTDIIEADGPESTLEQVRQERPDLICIASSLHPGGGAECCRRIKQDPELKDIPVIMICDSEDSPDTSTPVRDCGPDDFLIKPLDRLQFLQACRKFLPGVREHRQPSFFQVMFSVDGSEFRGKALDVSPGGLFLETKEELSEETLLVLDFKLTDSPGTRIKCEGKVRWVNRRPNLTRPNYPPGVGVKFLKLSSDAHNALVDLTGGG